MAQLVTVLAQTFVSRAKGIDKQEDFFKLLEETEKAFYKECENQVNSKLIKPLQKPDSSELVLTPQPTFLNTSQGVDEHYMHSQIEYERNMMQHASSIDHIAQQERLQQDHGLLSFPLYDRNFLDVNANSKFYHPEKHDVGIREIPRQFADQTNANQMLLNEIHHYNFENPEQKYVYPRGLITNTLPTRPLPEFIAQQEKEFKFKPAIDALGGYRDTINPMIPSLKENEQRLFLNTPQHSMLQIAGQPIKPNEIPRPPPEPLIPDPFDRNPQFYIHNLQPERGQSLIDTRSYLPVQQPQQHSFVQPIQSQDSEFAANSSKYSFLEQQRRLREQYSKKL